MSAKLPRLLVTFEASGFPDESKWTDDGSPLVPDGRSIADVISSGLRTHGFDAMEPTQHSFYGWAFDLSLGDWKAWCLLQHTDPWLLLLRERRSWIRWLTGAAETDSLHRAVVAINAVLSNSDRFAAAQWFTEAEYESGATTGASEPF